MFSIDKITSSVKYM